MRKQIKLVIILLFWHSILQAQNALLTQTVKGTVTDEQSGNVLGGVTLAVEGLQPAIAASTDSTGNFKLKNIPLGRQTFRVSMMGYEDAVVANIEITSSKEVVLEIKLKEKIKKLDDIVINTGKKKE